MIQQRTSVATIAPESLSDRLSGLRSEVSRLSQEQFAEMQSTLADAITHARGVSDNPAQPAGVRDLARRLADDVEARALTLRTLQERQL